MEKTVVMTPKAQKRAKVLEMLIMKHINQAEAGSLLNLCVRQIRRILEKYKAEGDEGLNHGLCKKQGNHRLSPSLRERIMAIVRDKYAGYKPTFISEKLCEDEHISIGVNTLRLWMIEEGLWEKGRKTAQHRSCRPRRKHFGEMLQMDGSIHDWFGTGQNICLMNVVDDATNTSYGLFDTGETTQHLKDSLLLSNLLGAGLLCVHYMTG